MTKLVNVCTPYVAQCATAHATHFAGGPCLKIWHFCCIDHLDTTSHVSDPHCHPSQIAIKVYAIWVGPQVNPMRGDDGATTPPLVIQITQCPACSACPACPDCPTFSAARPGSSSSSSSSSPPLPPLHIETRAHRLEKRCCGTRLVDIGWRNVAVARVSWTSAGEMLNARQGRAGARQGKAGQGRAGQGRAGHHTDQGKKHSQTIRNACYDAPNHTFSASRPGSSSSSSSSSSPPLPPLHIETRAHRLEKCCCGTRLVDIG